MGLTEFRAENDNWKHKSFRWAHQGMQIQPPDTVWDTALWFFWWGLFFFPLASSLGDIPQEHCFMNPFPRSKGIICRCVEVCTKPWNGLGWNPISFQLLSWAGMPSTRADCPKPCPTWPGGLPGMGQSPISLLDMKWEKVKIQAKQHRLSTPCLTHIDIFGWFLKFSLNNQIANASCMRHSWPRKGHSELYRIHPIPKAGIILFSLHFGSLQPIISLYTALKDTPAPKHALG